MAYQVSYVTGDGTPTNTVKSLLWDGSELIVGGQDRNIRCYSFNGLLLTHRCNNSPTASTINNVGFDGTYYYTLQSTSVYALSLNKTLWTWTNINSVILAAGWTAHRMTYNGTYLFFAYYSGVSGRMRAATFDGANFTLVGNVQTFAAYPNKIECSGGYIYVLSYTGVLYAYTFDGLNYSLKGSVTALNTGNDMCVFGSYIIVVGNTAAGGVDIAVYTFNGANFVLVAANDFGVTVQSVVHDGTYIHTTDSTNLTSYEVVGANIVRRSIVNTVMNGGSICNNSTFIFVGGGVEVPPTPVQVWKTTLRAQISASPTSGIAPLTVGFTAS